jgi:hypothetical protein
MYRLDLYVGLVVTVMFLAGLYLAAIEYRRQLRWQKLLNRIPGTELAG